jgi:sulfur carrier protein ThiS
MEVYLQKDSRRLELQFSGTAGALLAHLEMNSEIVLVVQDGKLVTLDHDISDAQKIELLSVISGG